MASTKDRIFPSTSDAIQIYVIFWIGFFGLAAASGLDPVTNAYGAINPVVMYFIGGLLAAVLFFRSADTGRQLINSAGLNAPIPGFGVLMFINGIGLGTILYTVFTGQLLAIAGMPVLTSIAQPFYNPYTASATSFASNLIGSLTVIFTNLWVALFEELYKLGLFKIGANWLNKRFGLGVTSSMIISLFITFALWGIWHLFSWPALTIASVFMAIIYGVFFISSYFVLGYLDISPPGLVENGELNETLSGIVLYPVVGAHFAWNVMVSTSGYSIDPGALALYGFALWITSLVAMFVVRLFQVPD